MGYCISESCVKRFVKYFPSAFEDDWMKNIGKYQIDMCGIITSKKQLPYFQAWWRIQDAIEKENLSHQHCGPYRMEAETNMSGIFSTMQYMYVCPKSKVRNRHPLHGRIFNESIVI